MLLNITNKYRHTHKAKPVLMKWIYTGVIRPKLTYACLIWGNKINTKILRQKLNSLNRLACLLTTNLTRITPQMSLEIILNIEPLEIHIKKLGLIAYKRLESKLDKVSWCTDTNIVCMIQVALAVMPMERTANWAKGRGPKGPVFPTPRDECPCHACQQDTHTYVLSTGNFNMGS